MANANKPPSRNSLKAADGGSTDYEVGYGKPPKANRFQPGRSGNPSGRRKAKKSLDASLHEALHSTAKVTINGRPENLSKVDIISRNLVSLASKGEPNGLRFLLALLKIYPALAKPAAEVKEIHKDMTPHEAMKLYEQMVKRTK